MNLIRREIARLHPAYAALVMATGIVSTGLAMFGWDLLSVTLLVISLVAFAVLLVAYGWRLIAYPRRVLADASDPGQGFGYFTLVAAPIVLGLRLALDHHPTVTAVLAVAGFVVWLVLTYALPVPVILGHQEEPVVPRMDGSWFMWVVGTQAIAAACATLAEEVPGTVTFLAASAVAFWGIGVILYLLLAVLITSRLLDTPVTPRALSPTYWVYMGATAITVFAAAKILVLPAALPVLAGTRDVVSGIAFLLWAFGTWWIPLLLVFAVCRYLAGGASVGYDPALWSMVFPLGMYAVASAAYGHATRLGFMPGIGHVAVWAGFVAWAGVVIAMGRAIFRGLSAADTGP